MCVFFSRSELKPNLRKRKNIELSMFCVTRNWRDVQLRLHREL